MKLNFKKSLITVSSILVVAGIGTTIATTVTSCSNIGDNKIAELIDDYEINQSKYDLDMISGMIISARSEGWIVDENNNIQRSQLSFDEVNSFFNQLTDVVNNGLEKAPPFHWYDYEPADWIQGTLQLFKPVVMPIFNWFINDTFFMKFLLSPEERAAATNWCQGMLNDEFRIKDWAKNELGLRETIFKGLLKPILCNRYTPGVGLWDWISLFYGNPWYLGINCEHYGDGNVLSSDKIDLEALPNFEMPTYTKYDYSTVQAGDLVYSANGFAIGDVNTGHMGIITGWKTDANGIRYLQCIEPDQYGVNYCAVCDERIDLDNLSILHIANSDQSQREQVVAFAQKQLFKDYYLPLFMTMSTDIDSPSWYCSELAWAAYKSVGLDIQNHEWVATIGCEPGATPHNIYNYEHTKILIQNEKGII
ncbi:MAG: hypothetical protein LBJ97_04560 [Mycoplasmataceae bacterium]|nr:hypothetical protein [Mycoplasmataceae bacterium]